MILFADLTGPTCQSPLALLISHSSHSFSQSHSLSYSHTLTLTCCISYLGGEFEGGDFHPPNQIRPNSALSSYAILTILTYGIIPSPQPDSAKFRFKLLCHTYYTYLWDFTICHMLLCHAYYTYYIMLYLWDLYHMFACPHK